MGVSLVTFGFEGRSRADGDDHPPWFHVKQVSTERDHLRCAGCDSPMVIAIRMSAGGAGMRWGVDMRLAVLRAPASHARLASA